MKVSNNLKNSQKQRARFLLIFVWTFSIIAIVGVGVFVALNFGNIRHIFAGGDGYTFTSTAAGGDWGKASTWTDGIVPANEGSITAILNGDITLSGATPAINGFKSITLNNGKSFTSGSSGSNNDLSIKNVALFNVANGTMVVYGNLTLTNTNLQLTNGSLSVTGTLSVNAGTTITVASGASIKAATLSVSNGHDAMLVNSGVVTVSGNILQGGAINNNSEGVIHVTGDVTATGSGSSLIANAGNIHVDGSIVLPDSSKLYVNQGGYVLVANSVTISANRNLIVGTSAAANPNADLVIQKDLVMSGSGNVLFDKSARVAIFGNVSSTGTGNTFFTVENEGQVYIHGNVAYGGGAAAIVNNNVVNPFGLYINGNIVGPAVQAVATLNKGSRTVMRATNVPFYTWVAQQPGSPLVNRLSYFKATTVSANGIKLNWATAPQQGFNKFVLERSTDNKTFNSVAEIAGTASGKDENLFVLTDEDPLNGSNYYRLTCLDLDGKFEYSDVLSVNFEGVKQLNLFPNPSNGEYVNYSINFDPRGDAFTIFDLSENKVGNYKINGKSGIITFDPTLLRGTYIVQFNSGSFKATQRIEVR